MGQAENTFAKDFFAGKDEKAVPFVPLRDAVVFPKIALPLVIRRPSSLAALDEAMKLGRVIAFGTQKDADAEMPDFSGIYGVGTLAKVREVAKQPDGSVRVLAEGVSRVRIHGLVEEKGVPRAVCALLPDPVIKKNERIEALMYSVLNQFRRVVNMGASVPFDVLLVILNVTDPWMLGDLVAANVELKTDEKQTVLEAEAIEQKLDAVSAALGRQIKVLQMASKIQADTGKELDKMQREMFLREQMKSIEKELDIMGAQPDADDLKAKLDKAQLPKDVRERALKEYDRLKAMPSFSPEASYLRTYLEWIAELPWTIADASVIDMAAAKRVLDADHFGLAKVKDRILEYLAVQKLVGKMRGPILCFVGPPGTGKTSLGKSIAKALNRRFHRISLGGVRDEAEIRGHRRTYVGALPGRIIQGIAAAKTKNPVFMLDEIDKIGADFRGDPAAALLEALDPEQNATFSDHYLEVPFDLSDVMFVTTANQLDTIPPALLDRMEVIEFAGYTEDEKLRIATGHLLPKLTKEHGISAGAATFDEAALRAIIRSYTREAGVRNLERELSAVFRKLARAAAEGKMKKRVVRQKELKELLGPEKFEHASAEKLDQAGVVTGLAWTEAGGEILQIEATRMPGKGALILTGQLGKVMQESATAAVSFVRSEAKRLHIPDDFNAVDVHIHVPSGAIPKDGPSAGLAMATAVVSLLSGRKAFRDVAMTGEITLRGRALEIGGVKEKVLAAHRAGMRTVILPRRNEKDLVDVPKDVRKRLTFVFADSMDDVLRVALAGDTGAAKAPAKRSAKKKKR